ncbi:type IX secretion system membrane protein PorP/SprF [Nonlabens sp. Ci31]|jgi:type IX secretion system PorP/SprF family membrane protein|uniref:PorP/SprF family type IX secretion system membrane protein n=1 Tax=Nonlabens sp. Ci31 TaxID=2608253 RepID=UPI001462DA56|nr:type IX secretion system membrane protein PorP/SprF [Nonlabens sp. Ci31]QJP35259.1 type IX secretion system membrane protein PorP/SprF [Nonlabens sp. Ci31]
MKNFNITPLLIVLIGMLSLSTVAQQDPQFTQYMYNQSILNPAYATANKSEINVGALYRSQWVGLEGAPKTASLFVHYPVSDRVEVGISFTNDDIGNVVTENNIYADFAYVLPVSETAKLSLGIKAGLTLFDANFNGFNLQSGGVDTDVAFNENVTQSFPNVGLGGFYFTDKFYVGLSAPNLLAATHLENENGIQSTGVQDIHFFLNSGYVFDINPDLKFKPSFLLKGVKGAPLSADLNANFLFNDTLEAGIGYRLDDSVSALVNFKVSPELRLGYAYDYTTSNLGNFNSGSHEIILLYNVKTKFWRGGYDRSPRFF